MMLVLILFAIGTTMLMLGLRSLKAQRLKERYALLFVLVGIPFLGLAVWPDAVGYLANLLNIQYTTVLLLAVTTFFLLMIFKLLAAVSVLERRVTSLAQLTAIRREASDRGLLRKDADESAAPRMDSATEPPH